MPDLDVDPAVLSSDQSEDPEPRTPLERAQAGEPLSTPDLQAIFKIKKSRFYQLEKAGAFDQFKLQPAISNYCYSGVKVARYLKGDPVYEPTFGRKRK